MVELGARIVLAAALVFVAGVFGIPDFDLTWKAAAAIGALAVFGQRLEAKGMKNAGVAGFLAVADAYAIALLLGQSGFLSELGFLVLAPLAYAAAKHGAQPNFMAPLGASALLVSFTVFRNGDVPSPMLLAQAGGILATGLLLSHSKVLVRREVEVQTLEAAPPDDYLELRENFRKLRDAYRDLERKSRRDRFSSTLEDARAGTPEKVFVRLCEKAKELTGCDSAALYSIAQFAEQLVVRATTPDYPRELEDASISIDLDLAPGQIRHRVDKAIRALQGGEDTRRVVNVLLIDRGRMVGMLCLSGGSPDKAADIREAAEELAPYLAEIVREEMEAEAQRRRLREAELLYEIASLGAGANNPTSLAARVSRELWQTLRLDHLGIYILEDNEPLLLSHEGVNVRLLETMTFAGGPGLNGWVANNAPEVIVFDARDDHRCNAEESLKRRIGSFCVIPLGAIGMPIGYVTAATHSRGGVDSEQVEMLRVVAAELTQALERLNGRAKVADGTMTPKEFFDRAKNVQGCLVYLEPLKREQLEENYGRPAVALAFRTLITRLRAKLPIGGCVCRREEGDYIVLLPTTSEAMAASWANDAAATASMIGVRTPDGTSKIPLAIRAKVAILDPQKNGVFRESVA